MEANTCAICTDEFSATQRKKIIHKSCGSEWEHAFHRRCIDKWIESQITNNETYPDCPLCNKNIPLKKIPSSLRKEAKHLLHEEEPAPAPAPIQQAILPHNVTIARNRLRRIMNGRYYSERAHPFMGILICVNNRIVLKETNSTFNFTINATIGQLKEEILSQNKKTFWYGSYISKLSYNLKPSNWINWTYPKYRVSDIHYGLPPYTHRMGFLENEVPLTDDCFFSQLYEDYQIQAGRFVETKAAFMRGAQPGDASLEKFQLMENIYFEKNLNFNGPTGIDDPGYYDRAFVNFQNPEIPEDMLAYRYKNYSTRDSLAWLVVHLEQI
jgi:hypothetical protein